MFFRKNTKAFFSRLFSTLLGLIILFNLGLSATHLNCEEHSHSEEQSCSLASEFDPCHRYIVHHEKSSSCDGSHKHFASKVDECFVCKYYKQRSDFTYFENFSFASIPEYKIHYVSASFEDKSSNHSFYYLRGPPITA